MIYKLIAAGIVGLAVLIIVLACCNDENKGGMYDD